MAAKRGWNIGLIGEALAVVIALFHRGTPWYARLVALLVLAYLVSPFNLATDMIPVVGWIDDLAIVPLGLWLASSLIPSDIMDNARARFAKKKAALPVVRK